MWTYNFEHQEKPLLAYVNGKELNFFSHKYENMISHLSVRVVNASYLSNYTIKIFGQEYCTDSAQLKVKGLACKCNYHIKKKQQASFFHFIFSLFLDQSINNANKLYLTIYINIFIIFLLYFMI